MINNKQNKWRLIGIKQKIQTKRTNERIVLKSIKDCVEKFYKNGQNLWKKLPKERRKLSKIVTKSIKHSSVLRQREN